MDFGPIEKGGAVALQLFLVMALMSTPLISVAVIIVPLMLNVVIQVVATVAIAYFVLFRLLGKDYDAAVTSGGFLGFGLSSMPVAMATMDEVGRATDHRPRPFCLSRWPARSSSISPMPWWPRSFLGCRISRSHRRPSVV